VQRDRITWPARAAPVPDARLHLTLHFLGNVPLARVPEIAAALPAPGPAFELRFGTLQAWRGGLVVLCPLAVPPALAALHATLGERLRELGLRVEARRFRPHVTLARHAAGASPLPPVPLLRWRAAGAVLVQSRPEGGYTVLARATGGPGRVTLQQFVAAREGLPLAADHMFEHARERRGSGSGRTQAQRISLLAGVVHRGSRVDLAPVWPAAARASSARRRLLVGPLRRRGRIRA
jgi:2'-5' RNA ligase